MPTPPQPPCLLVAMGNCFSTSAVPPPAPQAVAAAPPVRGLAPAGAPPPAPGRAKRGAVNVAEEAPGSDGVEALPKHLKSATETALVVAACKDSLLFRCAPATPHAATPRAHPPAAATATCRSQS